MKMNAIKILLALWFLLAYTNLAVAQSIEEQLKELNKELSSIAEQQRSVEGRIEGLKLERVQRDLQAIGLPAGAEGLPVICHSALCLAYDEAHEQARWVAHVVTPDIIQGNVPRTNDFRPDPKVATGTAEEEDYFLKYLQPDSTYEYDGYGYDRGHLAPSADFRWSAKALSESYYYSNMSPQLPEFNREKWAELEGALRGYLYRNPDAQLYVVTGPLIDENSSVVERSVNKVSIPSFFWKVVIDLKNQKGIGFILPHKNLTGYPLASFAVTIDQVEGSTGLDFFPAVEERLQNAMESTMDKADWLPDVAAGDQEPLYAPDLERNHFNTVQAKRFMDRSETIHVCGSVVGTRTSRKGNVLLNLDKQFPNQVFTVFVRKEFLVNFSYDPEQDLKDKKICARGTVVNLGGKPAMFIEKEEDIKLYEE
jgi:endonuclease G